MSVIKPVRATQRPEYARRAFIQAPWRGILTVRRWPRKRPRPRSHFLTQAEENLRQVVKYAKRVKPREQVPMREALERFDMRHRGFKASASMRHRDLEVQRFMGRSFIFILPDGTLLYPWPVVYDASDTLDWIHDTGPAVLMRRAHGWNIAPIDPDTRAITSPDETDQFTNRRAP